MNLYFVVPLLALVAVLQSTLAPHLRVGGVQPELVLLMVVSWSLRRGLVEGAVWAFCGGLALDMLSGGLMGSCSLALLSVAFVTSLVRGSLVRSRAALPWVMAVLGTLIYYAVLLIMMALAGRPVDLDTVLLRQAVPAAVYDVILVAVIYNILTWLDQRTGEPELRW